MLSSDQLSYCNETSGQKLVRKPNGANEASFCEDEFSFVLIEAPTNFNYNSLKAECCSGEDVLVVLSAGFLKTTKVSECFKTVYKMKTAISFLAHSLVALDLVVDIILNYNLL